MTADARVSVEKATARIGEQLSAIRTSRNVRVSELARQTGVSSSLISQIERGQSRPSVGTLFAIARVLDVAVDAFFLDEPSPAPPDDADEGSAVVVGAQDRAAGAAAAPTPAGAAPADADAYSGSGARNGPDGGEARVRHVAPVTASPSALPRADDVRDRHVVRRPERASLEIQGGVRWERLTPSALDGVEFLELVYSPGAESDRQAYRHPGVELVLVTRGVMTIFLGFEQHDLHPGDSIAFPSSTPHRYVNLTDGETRAVTVILRDDLSTLPLRDDGAAARTPADTGASASRS